MVGHRQEKDHKAQDYVHDAPAGLVGFFHSQAVAKM